MTKIDRFGGVPSFESAPEEAAQAAPAQEVGKVVRGGVRSPEETVRAFYDAFTTKKLDVVEGLYAPDAKFKDEIFEYKDRAGTMNMWRSIFAKGPDLKTSYKILGVEGDTVKAHWVADYTFLGRKVHNEIDTTMKVKDGKIVDHHDEFPWDKWAKQALPLGPLSATKPVRDLVTHVMRWSIDK